jgi:hypothetical protein
MEGIGTEDGNLLIYLDTATRIRTQDRRLQASVFAWDCGHKTLQFPVMRTSWAFGYLGQYPCDDSVMLTLS